MVLPTWLIGSLKFVMRPARSDVFSSSDKALWTNQPERCSEREGKKERRPIVTQHLDLIKDKSSQKQHQYVQDSHLSITFFTRTDPKFRHQVPVNDTFQTLHVSRVSTAYSVMHHFGAALLNGFKILSLFSQIETEKKKTKETKKKYKDAGRRMHIFDRGEKNRAKRWTQDPLTAGQETRCQSPWHCWMQIIS